MRLLGIDFGSRRIGLAVSDPSGRLARPLRTIQHTGSIRSAVAALRAVVDELATDDAGLEAIVMGLPVRLDGSPGPMTERVRKAAAALERAVGHRVILQDERLSSHEADARLAETERDWRARKARVDAAAAAVILQDHIDLRGRPASAVVPEGRP